METKFQTSFIPKKAAAPNVLGNAPAARRARTSIFMTIASIVFLVSLAGAGGAYAYKQYLTSAQETYRQQLVQRQQQFNIDLIEQLKQANIKINMAKQLISNHIAVSQVFDIVSRLTIKSVQFLDMDLSAAATTGQQSSVLALKMKGRGPNWPSAAFQSDVLGQLERYGLRKDIKNAILTEPSQDEEGEVSFSFSAMIEPKNISYERSVTPEAPIVPEQTGAPTQ